VCSSDLAQFGDLRDYSTVTVLWAKPDINMKHFIEELFGLPKTQTIHENESR